MSVTVVICIITGLISFQGFSNPQVIERLKHYPVAEKRYNEYYRLLSSGFVHGGWLHLLINLFVLYQFGPIVEQVYADLFGQTAGIILYLIMYLSCIVVADLPSYFKHKDNPSYAAVGASGAVAGVVFIYILFFPWASLSLYGIIPFRAIIGGIAYLAYSSWASRNRDDGIDHSAHFYGALYGILFTVVMEPGVVSVFIDQMVNGFPF